MKDECLKIGLGGGCHWCTEAVFQGVRGVNQVDQGWISSIGHNSEFSEAVIVHFNRKEVSLQDLIKIHLETHSSASVHSMRAKYRSAIYYFELAHRIEIEKILSREQDNRIDNIITQVLPFSDFKLNKESYLNYYLKNPDAQFCQRYIAPKLDHLEKNFGDLISRLKKEKST